MLSVFLRQQGWLSPTENYIAIRASEVTTAEPEGRVNVFRSSLWHGGKVGVVVGLVEVGGGGEGVGVEMELAEVGGGGEEVEVGGRWGW